MQPDVLFVRDFQRFQGGHLKVFDYFGHVQSSGVARASLYFTPASLRDDRNPWFSAGVQPLEDLRRSDAYFLAGVDWGLLDAAGIEIGSAPVINLVQAPRHADRRDPRYGYLRRRALRICVSEEVAGAIRETGEVNGPIAVIPAGIDLEMVQTAPLQSGVFIGALKNPALGQAIASILQCSGVDVDLARERLPRQTFLARMAAREVCVTLPNPLEGFFLPPLEAMAAGVAVVVPDCVGNRGFCRDGINCLMPCYETESLVQATLVLLGDAALRTRLVEAARTTASEHSLAGERARFLPFLADALGSRGRA